MPFTDGYLAEMYCSANDPHVSPKQGSSILKTSLLIGESSDKAKRFAAQTNEQTKGVLVDETLGSHWGGMHPPDPSAG